MKSRIINWAAAKMRFFVVVGFFFPPFGTGFYDEVSMRKGILRSCKIINKKNAGKGTGKPYEEIANKMFVSILT